MRNKSSSYGSIQSKLDISHVQAQAVKTSASFEQIRHAWYNEEARGEHPGVSREQFLHTDD